MSSLKSTNMEIAYDNKEKPTKVYIFGHEKGNKKRYNFVLFNIVLVTYNWDTDELRCVYDNGEKEIIVGKTIEGLKIFREEEEK